MPNITIIALALAGAAFVGWGFHIRRLRKEIRRAWLDSARPASFEKLASPIIVPIRHHNFAAQDLTGSIFTGAPDSAPTDPETLVIKRDKRTSHVHIRGVFGDGGENEGVLSVSAVLDASPYYPVSGLIIVGAPQASPLIKGYIPDLGGFSCGPEGAQRLITALQNAVRDVSAGLAARIPTQSSSVAPGTPPPPTRR